MHENLLTAMLPGKIVEDALCKVRNANSIIPYYESLRSADALARG